MPDTHIAAAPAAPPPMHAMDPRRGENLSPMFAPSSPGFSASNP